MLTARGREAPKIKAEAAAASPKSRLEPAARVQANPLWHQLATRVQRKLTVGAPNDPLEHEADRVADQVMRMPDPATLKTSSNAPAAIAATGSQQLHRACAACEEEEDKKLQTKPMGAPGNTLAGGAEAPPLVHDVLRSPGQPLDPATRAFFEPRFGHVRVHADERADAASAAVGARVYPVGNQIASGDGAFAPQEPAGRRLLAHELTHVVPQDAAQPALRRDAGQIAPDIVHRVLERSGSALPQAARDTLEPRFGADFSRVRMHTDADAAASARAIGARAYTVGSNIVFGEGQFETASAEGRHLLAHELAHFVQQSADATLRRVCAPSPLPPAPVPVGAGIPFRYVAAERCLQTHYAETHPAKPSISLSFNRDWTIIAGGSANEKAALGCLRGSTTPGATPNFTGKSGMSAGEPDIWDFLNQTMYEITTSNGAAFRRTKLGLEVNQANAITAPFDCGGLHFDRGGWAPQNPLKIDNDLYITTINDSGVLIYTVIKDATKELAVVLAALLASQMAKLKGGGGAGALAGKANTVYAAASLAAIAIMLASGKAEAKAGPGDEEPIAQMFKVLAQKGVPVPPSVQQLIESDPALKQKIADAMQGKSSPTDAQQAIAAATMKLIEANPDQFSKEDIEMLLASQEAAAAGGASGAPESAEKLRAMLDAVRKGQKASTVTGSGSGAGSGAAATPPAETTDAGPSGGTPGSQPSNADVAKAVAAVSGPRRRVLDALLGPGKGVPAAPVIADLIAALPFDLSDAEATQLITSLSKDPPATAEEVLDSVCSGVAVLRNNKASKPGGLTADQIAALADAAKAVPASFPPGRIALHPPEEAKTGKSYGLQLIGRTHDGVPYAAMASVQIDSVTKDRMGGTLLAHSDCIGTNGGIVLSAKTLAGQKVSTSPAAGHR